MPAGLMNLVIVDARADGVLDQGVATGEGGTDTRDPGSTGVRGYA